MTKCVVIHPTGEAAETEIPDRSSTHQGVLQWLQQTIDGYVETVDLGFGCLGWVDEEGLMKMKPFNVLATHLRNLAVGQRVNPLVGTMVITGAVDHDGYETDVTEPMINFLKAAQALN